MTESNTSSTEPEVQPETEPEAQTGRGSGADAEVLGATGDDAGGNTTEKDPENWVTGDQPATGAQKSYLDTLAREAGETLSGDLTKAEASEHIDRLQDKTGRGTS